MSETVNPTHEATAEPVAFFSVPFVELHMLMPGEHPTAKTRCFRIRRSTKNDLRVVRMAKAGSLTHADNLDEIFAESET